MTQHYERESMPERQPDFKWSVLDGELPSDGNFPDKERLTTIRESSKVLMGLEVQRRAYFSGLFLYSLEACNPEIFDEPARIKIIGNIVSKATLACMDLPSEILEKDLATITAYGINPKEVPIMQAFRLMQERQGIKHGTRRILDATVRAIYLRQEKINQE